jgi:hypothetical protein
VCAELPALDSIRRRTLEELARLPSGVLRTTQPDRYPVRYTERLETERRALEALTR